jgi:hypothetical protein
MGGNINKTTENIGEKNQEMARLRQREGELMNMKPPPPPPPPPKWMWEIASIY